MVNQLLKQSDIHQRDEVDGLSLAIKTVKLKANGVRKEAMSFEQIDFMGVHSHIHQLKVYFYTKCGLFI